MELAIYPSTNNSIMTIIKNGSTEQISSSCGNISVHDKTYNKSVRLGTLYTTVLVGTVGGLAVLMWILINRKLKNPLNSLSRVNTLIINLTCADLAVMFLAVVPQIVWEYQPNNAWFAGEIMCKLVKFLQSFSMMSSTNMLIAIAIDRHQAIRRPLIRPIAIWKLAAFAWGAAATASLPMMYVFHIGVQNGVTKCENIFRNKPKFHRQMFLTYVSVVVFVIPFFVLVCSYISIFIKISKKAAQCSKAQARPTVKKSGKIRLQSTHSTTLPRAKTKTLKMTFVIVLTYIICVIPYFIGEMIMSYGDHCSISHLTYALIGVLVAANSAVNPYIFLAFNMKLQCQTEQICLDGNGLNKTLLSSRFDGSCRNTNGRHEKVEMASV